MRRSAVIVAGSLAVARPRGPGVEPHGHTIAAIVTVDLSGSSFCS